MRRAHLAVLVLGVALFGLGDLLCRCLPNAVPSQPRLLADDSPRSKPGSAEPVATVEEDSLSEQQKEKIARVLETGTHTGGFAGLAVVLDSKELASASIDGTSRFWNPATGELLRVYRPRLGRLSALPVVPRDGRLVAVAGREDGHYVVQVIDPATGKVRSLKGHEQHLRALAFSDDGKWLAGIGTDQNLYLWNVDTGKLIKEIEGTSGHFPSPALFPTKEGLRLVTGRERVTIWKVPDGKSATKLKGHTKTVKPIAVTPDGKQVAGAGMDGVHLWEVPTGKATVVSTRPPESLSFSANSRRLSPSTMVPATPGRHS
jgi:WD40 repeat protein